MEDSESDQQGCCAPESVNTRHVSSDCENKEDGERRSRGGEYIPPEPVPEETGPGHLHDDGGAGEKGKEGFETSDGCPLPAPRYRYYEEYQGKEGCGTDEEESVRCID